MKYNIEILLYVSLYILAFREYREKTFLSLQFSGIQPNERSLNNQLGNYARTIIFLNNQFSKYNNIGDFSTALRKGEDYIWILDHRIHVVKLALRRVVNLRSGGFFLSGKGQQKNKKREEGPPDNRFPPRLLSKFLIKSLFK